MPARCPTMPCFGGPDLKTLYITTSRDTRPNAELSEQPFAGCVLALEVDLRFARVDRRQRPVQRPADAFGLVFAGLGVRVWAAGFAGRHTRSSKIEGSQLATAGAYAHVRNPIYLGSVILGIGMVILTGDRRLLLPCALTFLALYFGMIPAEEEFLSQKFQQEYEAYRLHVPRLLPQRKA